MGGEEVAVPYDAVRFDEESAIPAVNAAMLENAPRQADFSNEEFMQRLETHYGAAPDWQEPGDEAEVDRQSGIPVEIRLQ